MRSTPDRTGIADQRMRDLAVALARIVFGVVFVYFGAGELVAPGPWVGYMPAFLNPHLALWLVLVHGFVLFVTGVGLIVGTQLRVLLPLSVLLMGSIALDLLIGSGASAIWFRDLGLTALALVLWAEEPAYALDTLGQRAAAGDAQASAVPSPARRERAPSATASTSPGRVPEQA